MLYAAVGRNEFLREEFVAQLKALMHRLPAGEHNIDELSGTATTSEIIAACSATPFLCDKRMVIVRGAFASPRRQGSARPREAPPGQARPLIARDSKADDLARYVGHLPESTHLLIVEDDPRPIEAVLAARPDVVRRDFPVMRDDEVPSWIRSRARRHAVRISPRGSLELAQLFGADLRALDQEIAKLATYVDGGGTIDIDDVHALAHGGGGPGLFAFHDALAERRAGAALAGARALLAAGHDPVELFAQVTGVVRRLLITKELLTEGRPLSRDGAMYGLSTSPYVLRKLQRQAAPIATGELERAYRLLRDTDVAIKTGRCEPELAVELVVGEILGFTPRDQEGVSNDRD